MQGQLSRERMIAIARMVTRELGLGGEQVLCCEKIEHGPGTPIDSQQPLGALLVMVGLRPAQLPRYLWRRRRVLGMVREWVTAEQRVIMRGVSEQTVRQVYAEMQQAQYWEKARRPQRP